MMSNILKFIVTLSLASYVFKVYFGFNYIYSLAVLFLVFCFLFVAITERKIKSSKRDTILLLIYLMLITLVSVFFNSETFYFYSFFYEFYKILCPFVVISLFSNDKIISRGANNVLFVFLLLNAFVLLFQNIYGVQYFDFIGLSVLDEKQILYNRPNGLTENANVIGSFAFLAFVYAFNIDNKNIKYISFIVVFLSTSKTSVLVLLFYLAIRMYGKNFIRGCILALFILLPTIYTLFKMNVFSIMDKFERYYTALFDGAGGDLVEGRIKYWFIAFDKFAHQIYGYGLGTWGDFSSSFNPIVNFAYDYTRTSDSYASHLLVEQGVISLLFYIILFCFIKTSARGRDMIAFYLSILIFSLTNFAFSQQLFLVGFGLVIASFSLKTKNQYER